MIRRHPTVGRFIGESHQIRGLDGGRLTPDISSIFDLDKRGLVFEIKYSIGSSVEDYLLKVKRYRNAVHGWPTSSGQIETNDVVLLCNANDTPRVLACLSELSVRQDDEKFFTSPGFSVWQWIMGSTKEDREDSMWLQRVYGKTRNTNLEELADTPGGIRITEDVLRFLRFQHMFVRDKPPIQYVIVFLVQHVLPKQPDVSSYDIELEIVYDRANSFFPGWWEAAEETRQVKRELVKEALNRMVDMRYITKIGQDKYQIPNSLLGKKRLLDDVCRRLENIASRQARRPRVSLHMRRSRKLKRPTDTSSLDRFI